MFYEICISLDINKDYRIKTGRKDALFNLGEAEPDLWS